MIDLGECIYEKDFHRAIERNDGNGHLNNGDYSVYSEQIRKEFFKLYGWSDEEFNEKQGVSMRMGQREIRYRLPLKKGEEARINLQIYFRKNPFFHMIYTFYNPEGNKAAIDKTMVGFVDVKTERVIPVPDFFMEKLGKGD
jgi:acyl-CoA thioesterase FadM